MRLSPITSLPVTDTPTDVKMLLFWTAPTTPVAGYEVFYETADGERHSVGNTTDTKLTLSRLEGEVCSIFVVAYEENDIEEASGDEKYFVLPSARSNVTCLSEFLF